jgi:hypothetical protein
LCLTVAGRANVKPIPILAARMIQLPMPGTGTFLLLAFSCLVIGALLVLLHLTRLGFLVRSTIPDRPRRRMFLASLSFVITFIGVRLLVSAIVHNRGPFGWVMVGGRHIHHLVWGILILLLVGYGWLLDLGRTHSPLSIFMSRLMSVSYGVGAALTLDEFALWLNLEPDAYWTREGRISIDAVIVFGGILAVGAWGAPFFRGVHRMLTKHEVPDREPQPEGTFPIRRVRLLRPRRVQKRPPNNAP